MQHLLKYIYILHNSTIFLNHYYGFNIVKCYIFQSYCCNLYCAPFWYDSTKDAMKNLKIPYNNGLRRLLGLPSHNRGSDMFVNLNIPCFGDLVRNKLETSDNIIIHGIYLSQFLLQSGIYGFSGVIFCRRNYIIVHACTHMHVYRV